MKKSKTKPAKAICKPPQSLLLGNRYPTDCDPKATIKPPQSLLIANRLRLQSHPNATLKRLQNHPHATLKPPTRGLHGLKM